MIKLLSPKKKKYTNCRYSRFYSFSRLILYMIYTHKPTIEEFFVANIIFNWLIFQRIENFKRK